MTSPRRVYVLPSNIQGRRARIEDPQELHHLLDVLRAKPGHPIECFDGQGRVYQGRIVALDRTRCDIELHGTLSEPSEQRMRLTLGLALLKGVRFEWVIQKATELGVARIVPLITARVVARPVIGRTDAKVARWRRIAAEAAKQCRQATLPAIDTPQRLKDVLPSLTKGALLLMPTLVGPTMPLARIIEDHQSARDIVVLIGPEGDFTPEEVALAVHHGARLVSLGSRTLRSETAAIATVAILQCACEIL